MGIVIGISPKRSFWNERRSVRQIGGAAKFAAIPRNTDGEVVDAAGELTGDDIVEGAAREVVGEAPLAVLVCEHLQCAFTPVENVGGGVVGARTSKQKSGPEGSHRRRSAVAVLFLTKR